MKESKMVGIVTWIIAAGLAWLVFFVLVPVVIKQIPATPWKGFISIGIYLATFLLTLKPFGRVITRGWLEFNGTMDEIRLRKKFHL